MRKTLLTVTIILALLTIILFPQLAPSNTARKPILYLYPTEETNVRVTFEHSNYLTTTTTISSYNGNNLEFTSYNFQIFADFIPRETYDLYKENGLKNLIPKTDAEFSPEKIKEKFLKNQRKFLN